MVIQPGSAKAKYVVFGFSRGRLRNVICSFPSAASPGSKSAGERHFRDIETVGEIVDRPLRFRRREQLFAHDQRMEKLAQDLRRDDAVLISDGFVDPADSDGLFGVF